MICLRCGACCAACEPGMENGAPCSYRCMVQGVLLCVVDKDPRTCHGTVDGTPCAVCPTGLAVLNLCEEQTSAILQRLFNVDATEQFCRDDTDHLCPLLVHAACAEQHHD